MEERLGLAGRKKIVAGIEGGVAQVVPRGAMQLVGAALGDHVHDAANHGAKFRVVGVRYHLEFLNGINDRRDRIGAVDGSIVGEAIREKVIAAVALPVDGRKGIVRTDRNGGAEAATSDIGAILGGRYSNDARSEREQGGEISTVQREVVDLLGRDHGAQAGVRHVQLGGGRLNGNHLCLRSHGESKVKCGGLAHGQHERRLTFAS